MLKQQNWKLEGRDNWDWFSDSGRPLQQRQHNSANQIRTITVSGSGGGTSNPQYGGAGNLTYLPPLPGATGLA